MSEGDRRQELARITETTLVDIASGAARRSTTYLPRGIVRRNRTPIGEVITLKLPFDSTQFEKLEEITETTYTGIRKPEPPTVMERLMAEKPEGKNIVAFAVTQLDDPVEMAQFLIQYANDLRESGHLEESRNHPFESAAEAIKRMAALEGGEPANRWTEFFGTGTVKDLQDHSLDWIKPRHKPQTAEEIRNDSLNDFLTESSLIEETEHLLAVLKLDNIRSGLKIAEERRDLAERRSKPQETGLVEAERKMVALGLMLEQSLES